MVIELGQTTPDNSVIMLYNVYSAFRITITNKTTSAKRFAPKHTAAVLN